MTIVIRPGIYPGIPQDLYHREGCCDGPSLSSTGARVLATECPATYRYELREEKDEFDIGNATHLLVLQPEDFEKQVGRMSFSDYRKKEAQAERNDIRASGRIPLLPKDLERVIAMRNAIMGDPVAGMAFQNGEAEASFFWRDPEYGFWCKARPDYYPFHGRYLLDVKTSTSANPKKFENTIADCGYDQQADWYMSGVEAVTGQRPQKFAFVVVSKKPPHLVSVCWLKPDSQAMEWGQRKNRYARGIFAWCLKHNEWPSYRPVIGGPPAGFDVDLPQYAVRRLQERMDAGEFEPPSLDQKEAA